MHLTRTLKVKVMNGKIAKGDKIVSCHTSKTYEIAEIGVLSPAEVGLLLKRLSVTHTDACC
jgi:translation elongation factor EF-4